MDRECDIPPEARARQDQAMEAMAEKEKLPFPSESEFFNQVANKIDGMPVPPDFKVGEREYVRQGDGSLRRIRPEGSGPVNWKDRAIKAEKMFLGLLEERKKLQMLLLENCMKLEGYGFTCDGGSLHNCKEFVEIKAFARGVPNITRPPLETMPLNGKRVVKLIKVRGEGQSKVTDCYLECGHTKAYPASIKSPGMREEVVCENCVRLLQEYGMFNDEG